MQNGPRSASGIPHILANLRRIARAADVAMAVSPTDHGGVAATVPDRPDPERSTAMIRLPMTLLVIAALGSIALAEGPKLQTRAFTPLPLGDIKPAGWLAGQLRDQADGLTGHLDEFWPDIKESAWIGGNAEGWERLPYWLDGAVPLAYLLDDDALKSKVDRTIGYILDHQQADGWLGPIGDNNPGHKPYDVWPLFVLFKALRQYAEATDDPRVITAMMKAARKIDEVITKEPLYSWSRMRAADFVVTLLWLHDRTEQPWLLDLARKVFAQGHDWKAQFDDLPFKRKVDPSVGLPAHGVNIGMALKYAPLRWQLTGDIEDRDGLSRMLTQLDRYHGQATGIFTCDELLAGRSPSQGTELCTVVEAMYALEESIAVLGDARLADRLERIAFNALPATITPDFTAHQYDQQANQIVCKISPEHVYVNNGPDANIFGLEPNFGCCTANLHQGWPKLASHLWMKSPYGGLAAIAYAPCVVEMEIDGKPVKVEVRTQYPFRDTVAITVRVPEAMTFPLHIRIPEWAKGARIGLQGLPASIINRKTHVGTTVTGERYEVPGEDAGQFVHLSGEWSGTKTITLRFPMSPGIRKGFNDAISIERGPLVFALKVGSDWKKVKDREGLPFDDWEVHPTTPWNYALAINREHPEQSITFDLRPIGDRPFSPEGAPIVAHAKGRLLPEWGLEKNAAAPPPQSPVLSKEPIEDLTLIPYGCTDLRITEFPTDRTGDVEQFKR